MGLNTLFATRPPALKMARCWRCILPDEALVVTNPEVSSVRDSTGF
jgi:septum formation inhibitor-activating ATPase MinD